MEKRTYNFQFGRRNYLLMAAGVALMVTGYLLMQGGAQTNPDLFNPDEIYSFRRVTLAPVLVTAGLVLEVFAIFVRDKSGNS